MMRGGVLAILAIGAAFCRQLEAVPPAEVEIAGFATSLAGRSASQRHNARLAAEALDGRVIPPGGVFSFNRTVRSWSFDQGYVKAPVSYDGELVYAFGGGVCQTSTTLYNAALLAGLPVLERHTHVFSARYAPPGRDAAVAQPGLDLRFRNPYPFALRLRASARDDRLDIRFRGARRPETTVQVASEMLEVIRPDRLTRVVRRPDGASGRAYVRAPGATGYRVVTYRLYLRGGKEIQRERLSDDTYQAMDRVIALTEDGG